MRFSSFSSLRKVLSFNSIHFATLAFLIVLPCNLSAAEQSTSPNEEPIAAAAMEEVVVTAPRYREEIYSVPANVTVITESDIKNSTAINIPELLRSQEGIQVTDVTGNNRTYTVDLRGFGDTAGSNTLVLIDGRRVTQADLSGTDWTQIPLDRVKRIEIVRGGSGSVFYGDNASGGVVNIITKEGEEETRYGADVSAGSYRTFHPSAYVEGTEKALSFAFTGGYLTSNGYRLNSGTDAKDVGASLKYNLSDVMKIYLSSGYHRDETGMPGALTESDLSSGKSRMDSVEPNNYANTEDYYFSGGAETYFWGDSLFKLEASFRQRDALSYYSYSGGNFTGDTGLKNVSLSPQVLLQHKIAGRFNNRLTFGMDYQYAKEEIEDNSLFFGSRSIGNYDLKKSDYGYYVHDKVDLTGDLSISAGYRYDRAEFSFSPGTPNQSDDTEYAVTAGANYNFLKQSQVYFNYSRSFRYPLLDEQFSFETNTVTPLQPQVSQDYELGAKHYITPKLRGSINIFQMDTRDEIIYNPYSYSNENLDGKTHRDGIEASVNWQALDFVSFFATYTYLIKARVDGGQFDGKWIPGVPQHSASVGTLVSFTKSFTMGIDGVYVGSRPFSGDPGNQVSDQDSYYVINAKLQYRWNNLKAYLNLNNITDVKYSEYGVLSVSPTVEKAFYPSPEMNFLLGLAIEI
jgi:iron complex outermembrane receptor protein